ncbi:hypothetical protein H0W91_04035 [Patescibacteria group bacterium]|nr:hypothetical protein [Patescibacteria group bacterium]
MKFLMCKAIARNIAYLLSWGFWKPALSDPDYPAKTMALLILFAAFADIMQMILKPGYPSKVA